MNQRITELEAAVQERDKTITSLQRANAIQATVMDNLNTLIYVADMQTYEMLYLNKFGTEIFGSYAGRRCWEVLQEGQQGPCTFCTNSKLVDEDGEPTGLYTWEFQNTVNQHWYSLLDQAIRWHDGRIVRLEVATDVTSLKQAQEQLRVFQTLIENAPDSIAVATFDGVITYGNAAMRHLFGYDENDTDNSIQSFYAEETHEQLPLIAEELRRKGTWHGLCTGKTRDGRKIPVSVSAFVIQDNSGEPIAWAAIVRDITEEQHTEQERLALKEQIIEAQQSALRELSTPLIPLAENLVALPLVGTIDTRRAQQVMETLLEGIAFYQAEYAIVDITGVKIVDTQVANALIQAAQAVRLLGAQVILTGIGPAMAQTLVTLGADLSSIITLGTLQHGIQEVIKRNTMRVQR